jgi:hypothetical protein
MSVKTKLCAPQQGLSDVWPSELPVAGVHARGKPRMKDQLIAILEAVRLSQAALTKHSAPGGATAEATLKELRRFLLERHVVAAMEALYPNVESPNTSPDDSPFVDPGGWHAPLKSGMP